MPFLNDLVLKSNRESNFYTLDQPLSYEVANVVYTAHAGFQTDLASIPQFLRAFISDDASCIRDAAVIHDYLYSTKPITRKEADKVLYLAMLELKSPKLKAYLVYLAVRLFGGQYYSREFK